MSVRPALELDYVPVTALEGRSDWHDVLGVVGYAGLPAVAGAPVPVTASMTPALRAPALCEVWRVTRAAEPDLANGVREDAAPDHAVHYRYCQELVFGSVRLDERRFVDFAAKAGPGADACALEQATFAAYAQIFDILRSTGHPHLVRVWNYLPDINGQSGGDERYRRFNWARQRAFKAAGRETVGSVPAASALGSPAGSPLSVYFLASSTSPVTLENPRQISAYHYPPKYGTHTPSFSRACLLEEWDGTNLFVSGTASIVGHESRHPGDVVAQTRETLANIEALVQEANRVVGERHYALDALKLKVYVRRPEDLPRIERTLAEGVSPAVPIVYLTADVCRTDLLVEIEATGGAMT